MRISDWSSDVCSSDLWTGRNRPVTAADLCCRAFIAMGIDRHGIVGQPIGWFEQYRCPGNGAILGCHVWTGDTVHQSIALGPSRSEAYFQAIADRKRVA